MVNGGYDMIDYLAIGKRIKRLRIQKHMTQEQLGNSIGLSAKHVSNIETNNAHPSLEALIQIANALECSLDFLVLESIVETPKTNYNQEFSDIIQSCNTREKHILIECAYAIKKILKENP